MALPDVRNRAAVGHNVAVEAPFCAQDVSHQTLVGTTRFSVRSVVGAHNRIRVAFDNRRAKRRQIRLSQISFVSRRVKAMTFGFWSAVHCVVFRGRDYFEVARVIALQTLDESDAQTRGEKWILAVSFLSASPARVAKDIDIGTPES